MSSLSSSSSSWNTTSASPMTTSTSGAPVITMTVLTLFHYSPSQGAAITFLIFFLLASFASLIATSRYRRGSWFMLIVFGTGIFEVMGFSARVYLSNNVNTDNFKPLSSYVLMSTCLIISPNALALVNYIIVSRIILTATAADRSRPPVCFLLRSKFVTPFFLCSDLLAFAIQGGASGMLTDPSSSATGQKIMMVGLSIQLVFFSIFTLIAATIQFHSHYRSLFQQIAALHRVMRCIWFTISMLYIRSIYRLIEFGSGFDGPVASQEALMYVFDSLPVLLCFASYSYDHFGRMKDDFLKAEDSMHKRPDTTEATRDGLPHEIRMVVKEWMNEPSQPLP